MEKEKVAGVISIIFSPPVIGLFITLILTFKPPYGQQVNPFLAFLFGLCFIVILPILPVIYASKKGKVELDVPNKEKRGKFLLISIITYFTGFLLANLLNMKGFSLMVFSYFLVTFFVLFFNYFIKISIHTTGVAGPATALVFFYGLEVYPFWFILLPVFWARLVLKKHDLFQLLLGVVTGVSVTFLAFHIVVFLKPFLK